VIVHPWDQPWATLYEKQEAEALDRALALSDAQLRRLRPPLPQIVWLPPRFGYPTYDQRQWGVMQVFGLTRTPSGRIPGFPSTQGQDRVTYSQDQARWQGSDRNTNSADPLGLGNVS